MRRLLLVLAAVLVGALLAPTAPATAAGRSAAQLERRLTALHCDAGRADGRIDKHTRAAVVRFQSRVGLRQTGDLDRRTRSRLLADGAPRCDRRPVPKHSGHGRRIVVSQHQNWVWLVNRSGRVVAQGGMIDNTRVLEPGSHATGSYCGRAARIHRNQDYGGKLWLDDFVRFAPCGVGFHRIPRHKSDGSQIHPDWYLGTDLAQSHGCLRLSRTLADHVWDFTARRTPVRVVR